MNLVSKLWLIMESTSIFTSISELSTKVDSLNNEARGFESSLNGFRINALELLNVEISKLDDMIIGHINSNILTLRDKDKKPGRKLELTYNNSYRVIGSTGFQRVFKNDSINRRALNPKDESEINRSAKAIVDYFKMTRDRILKRPKWEPK